MKRFLIFMICLFASSTSIIAAGAKEKIQINVKGVVFNMIYVAPGSFTMGALDDEDYDEREHPSHQVALTHGYYIAETEVTQALWEAVMGNNPSEYIGKNKPVDSVNWDDCKAFVAILNLVTDKKFRLPTEAEWEYAAKGGNKSKGYIYSGSNNLHEVAWYIVNSGVKPLADKTYYLGVDNNSQTHDVKTKKPNELGIYDMSGNVVEWCEDEYIEYTATKQFDPISPSYNKSKVHRGGDYRSRSRHCRNTFRVGFEPTFCTADFGFRLVLDEDSY